MHDFDCQSFYDIYQTKKKYEIKQICYIIRLRNNLPCSFQDELKKVKLLLEDGRLKLLFDFEHCSLSHVIFMTLRPEV